MNADDGAANNAYGRKNRYTSLINNNMDDIDISDIIDSPIDTNMDDIDIESGRLSLTRRVTFIDDAAPDVVADGAPSDSPSLNSPKQKSPVWVPCPIPKALTKSPNPDFNAYKSVTRASIFSEKVQRSLLMTSQSDTHSDSSPFRRGNLIRQNGQCFSARSIDTTQNEEDIAFVALIATQLRTNFLFMSLKDDEIITLAHKFEIVSYNVGPTIIEQDSNGSTRRRKSVGGHRYYHIVVDGDCEVFKDGKQINGKFGVIEKGTPFGEDAILFHTPNIVSIIASKPPIGENTITVFRLKGNMQILACF